MTIDLDKLRQMILAASAPQTGAVALPKDMTLRSLERFSVEPRRMRGEFKTGDPHELIAFLKDEVKESGFQVAIFLEESEKLKATAYLNFGSGSDPQWHDYRAICQPILLPLAQQLNTICGCNNSQQEMIEFLEDYRPHLHFYLRENQKREEVLGEQAYQQFRSLTLDVLRSLRTKREDFALEKSSMERVALRASVPNILVVNTAIYYGLEPQIREFRITPFENSGSVLFRMREIAAQEIELRERHAFAELLEDAFEEIKEVRIFSGAWINKEPTE